MRIGETVTISGIEYEIKENSCGVPKLEKLEPVVNVGDYLLIRGKLAQLFAAGFGKQHVASPLDGSYWESPFDKPYGGTKLSSIKTAIREKEVTIVSKETAIEIIKAQM